MPNKSQYNFEEIQTTKRNSIDTSFVSMYIRRFLFFSLGLFLCVAGVVCSTRSGFGVSPVTAVAFSLSKTMVWSMAQINLMLYLAMVAVEFLIRGKDRRWRDLLQIPMSIAFNVLLGWMDQAVPVWDASMGGRVLLLVAAVVFCGTGIFLLANMDLMVTPPDGLLKAIVDVSGKNMGLVKNTIDFTCVAVSFIVDAFLGDGPFSGIGIGTVVCMLFIGRVVHLWERYFKTNILRLAKMDQR